MTAKKPDPTDNLMLIIGQLLEATKAAAEGLKSVSAEVQGNAKAIITMSTTVRTVETKLLELNKIVSDAAHPGNLIVLTAGHTADIKGLRTGLDELEKMLDDVKKMVASLNTAQTQVATEQRTTSKYLILAVKVLGWALTTAVAIYAAVTAAGK